MRQARFMVKIIMSSVVSWLLFCDLFQFCNKIFGLLRGIARFH